MTWAESPMCGQVGEDFQDKIMHQSLKVGDTVSDGRGRASGTVSEAAGNCGLHCGFQVSRMRELGFQCPGGVGSVQMPFQETFWAKGFWDAYRPLCDSVDGELRETDRLLVQKQEAKSIQRKVRERKGRSFAKGIFAGLRFFLSIMHNGVIRRERASMGSLRAALKAG